MRYIITKQWKIPSLKIPKINFRKIVNHKIFKSQMVSTPRNTMEGTHPTLNNHQERKMKNSNHKNDIKLSIGWAMIKKTNFSTQLQNRASKNWAKTMTPSQVLILISTASRTHKTTCILKNRWVRVRKFRVLACKKIELDRTRWMKRFMDRVLNSSANNSIFWAWVGKIKLEIIHHNIHN